jgi:hypothetical protein
MKRLGINKCNEYRPNTLAVHWCSRWLRVFTSQHDFHFRQRWIR